MRPSTPASGSAGCLLFFAVPFVLLLGIVGYGALLSMKGSPEYGCALEQLRKSSAVVEAIGEPVEPGLFVWTQHYKEEGATRESSFGFQVSGPRGQGTVDASTYRTPIGSSMTIRYEGRQIYGGTYPCR